MAQRTADSLADEPGAVTRLVGSDPVLAVLVALAQHPFGVTLDDLARMLAGPEHVRLQPILQDLADRFQETAHYAVLDGRSVVYRAQVDPSVRRIRSQGYATGAQENEVGISCLAVPVFFTTTSVPAGAVGISALDYRTPLSSLVEALPDIITMVDPLGHGAA